VFSSGESLVRSLDDKFGTQTISLDRAINAYWVQVVVETFTAARNTATPPSRSCWSIRRMTHEH
jgi:hypothetical protein